MYKDTTNFVIQYIDAVHSLQAARKDLEVRQDGRGEEKLTRWVENVDDAAEWVALCLEALLEHREELWKERGK